MTFILCTKVTTDTDETSRRCHQNADALHQNRYFPFFEIESTGQHLNIANYNALQCIQKTF